MRRLGIAATTAALLAAAPAASAGPAIDRAVSALKENPVYVAPEADARLRQAEQDRLANRIASARAGPMYIAVLPAEARNEAGGDSGEVLQEIWDGLQERGTYAVVVGDELRAGSTELEEGRAGELAIQALEASSARGVAATLSDFVGRVGRVRQGQAAGGDGGSSDGVPGIAGGILLGIFGAGGAAFALRRRRRSRRALAEVKDAVREDLIALGSDISDLDLDVEMPSVAPAAKEDYGDAVRCYQRANEEFDRIRRPEQVESVTGLLEAGRFAMASAKARLEGREPPERRAPCFFDPRHGPSRREVEWAPPGGASRAVPACEADAQRVEQGLDPAAREVMVGGRSTPYWDAPAHYGPWAGGFYGGFGGLLPGLLMGSMLGSAFGATTYAEASPGAGDGGDSGAFGGDGDFGGGDFGDGGGGGDFGGGGFGGGGDFGGGG